MSSDVLAIKPLASSGRVQGFIGSGAGTATSTAANIYPLEARLDVINGESANEGVVTTAAVAAVNKTRVHWL